MPTPPISNDLRTRIVAHYKEMGDATYQSTATLFRVGRATVNRILRVQRETGDVSIPVKPKKPKFKIDLAWLEAHARAQPDARLKDRAADFKAARGIEVSVTAVYYALSALGFTHKKKRSTRRSATPTVSERSAMRSSLGSPR
jgi:transposase